jgi:DeoR/GlpR family transcriptional regulator of sugar metabolism
VYESSLAFRLHEMAEAKRQIARMAVRRIQPGSSVVLDDSTTALAMLPELARIPELTIITNFVSIIEELTGVTDGSLELVAVGGTYNPKYHSFGGVLAERALREFRVDRCFLSVAAVDAQQGAFHQEPDQAAIKRTMTEIAGESTLLADASKFTKRAVHRVAGFEAFSDAIVDDATDPVVVAALRSRGLDVEIARPPEWTADQRTASVA